MIERGNFSQDAVVAHIEACGWNVTRTGATRYSPDVYFFVEFVADGREFKVGVKCQKIVTVTHICHNAHGVREVGAFGSGHDLETIDRTVGRAAERQPCAI